MKRTPYQDGQDENGDERAVLVLAVSEDRDHAKGPSDAPVTLVEYGDYECPYCGEAYPIVKAVQEQMGDQLRFVFRNFPLTNSHPHAQHAAEAAETAAAQGKFWEMHDHLFEHQGALGDATWRSTHGRSGWTNPVSLARCPSTPTPSASARTSWAGSEVA